MKRFLDRTFLQLGRGFQFSAEPPASLTASEHLRSGDTWTVVGCVLARARAGDLRAVEVLPDLMARDDRALVWNACVQLLGFAGRTAFVLDTAERFLARPDDAGLPWALGDLLRNVCSLDAVPLLLRLHAAVVDDDARRHLEHCLSTLLEQEPGPLAEGAASQEVPDPAYPEAFAPMRVVLDRDGYAAQVRAVAAGVEGALAHAGLPVTAGQTLDIPALARRLHARIRDGEPSGPRMEWERMGLEASTGIDCSAFYADARLQPLAALATLEDAFEDPRLNRLAPGARHFFGHRVDN